MRFLNTLFAFDSAGSLLLDLAFSSHGQCRGVLYSCGVRTTHCRGFSCCRGCALVCRLSGCDVQTKFPCGMRNPLGPGIKPGSPALAGGFLSAIPPGKSYEIAFNLKTF